MGGLGFMINSNVVFKGSLNFIGLGELLQLLGGSGSTGTIKLTSIYAETPGYIYLNEGNPINAEVGDKKGLDALNSFFGWVDATFEFTNEPVNTEKLIRKNRMEIILDGLRMVDDGVIEKLGRQTLPSRSTLVTADNTDVPVIRGPLIDYIYVVDEEEFSEGKEIVIQEKFGSWLWVVLQGTVEVYRALPEGRVSIVRLTDGAFIGSISSLFEKVNVRSATVVAKSRVQLGVLDYERIFREVSNMSLKFKGILNSQDKRLKEITNTCADAIVHKAHQIDAPRNMKPFTGINEKNDAVFQIRSGNARILRKMNRQFIDICSLGEEDVIGHIPFLNTSHEPHSASVFVSEDFAAEPIDLTDIKEEYDSLSDTLKNLIQHISICTSVTTGRVVDLLKNVSDD